jgi:glutamate synthase (ferredoxin)
MMRVCNLDTCPVGVATQNPELRKNFKGKPENVINFMEFVAEELREYMAKLGVKTIDELVGRTDLLKEKKSAKVGKAQRVDLSALLSNPYIDDRSVATFDPKQVYQFGLEKTLDEKVLLKKLKTAMANHQSKTIQVDVTNVDRTFGTILGSEITKTFEDTLEEDTYKVQCNGSGGQSFGAFIPKGITLTLEGDSNDYIGKGLSGGKVAVYPPKGSTYKPEKNIIIGNVAFYGATGGEAYISGAAGERFCVRNSGVSAVVEAVGDHGCEYMTGGNVVVLGSTGRNFAAGMSGGIAFIVYLAALQDVPDEQYESALIDGASFFQRVRYIALPQIKGIVGVMLVLSSIQVFNMFDEPMIMTGGGPYGSSETIVLYAFQKAYRDLEYGYAVTISTISFLITFLITIIQMKFTSKES